MTDMTDFERAVPTNADVIQPSVDHVKKAARLAVEWARDHPDELAVAAVPAVLLTLATARHRLNLPERVLLSQCGYWAGVLAVDRYRAWKTEPISLLRKVAP